MPDRTGSSPAPADSPARREPLTRGRILATACRLMDEEGLEAVTMRRIGRELGVEAMSLYNHVEDKDEILSGICEVVMAEFRYPEPTDDWARAVWTGAHEWRRVLKAHPNVIRLFAETRKMAGNVEALGPMNFALGVFHDAGLRGEDVVKAFRVFGGYIQGFVMMELGPIFGGDEDAGHAPEHHPMGSTEIPADALPHLASAFPYFHDCDPQEQFGYGLELLIEGLASKTGRPPG